jgi:uncharacterized protein YkwD
MDEIVASRATGGSAKRAFLAVALVAAVLGSVSFVAVEPASAASTARSQMLGLTNKSRVSHGVRKLKLNPRLSRVAARHSRAMASKKSLFHSTNIPHVLRSVRWSSWGENVGMTTGDLEGLQGAFMRSLMHRKNILNRRFTHVGIGVAKANGTYWVTLIFYG